MYFHLGSFTNYVIHFSLFFDHLPTYGYVLASILLIIYLIKICDSYILLTTYPPRRHNVICERPPVEYSNIQANYSNFHSFKYTIRGRSQITLCLRGE